jgi:hypothetical protein
MLEVTRIYFEGGKMIITIKGGVAKLDTRFALLRNGRFAVQTFSKAGKLLSTFSVEMKEVRERIEEWIKQGQGEIITSYAPTMSRQQVSEDAECVAVTMPIEHADIINGEAIKGLEQILDVWDKEFGSAAR